jgi:2-polyprenyl-3-methyl-5-hydroxy-6-metoxy-1,4-benzoquinol methylase
MIDLDLFKNIMEEARDNTDLLDSYSPNQFKSKENLINHIKSLNILNKDSEIVIFGSWYGSILIPAFYNQVKKITAIDMDKKVIGIAKNRLFKDYNVDFITSDVFEVYRDMYDDCDLFINTSCEHMKHMREWGPAPKYKTPWWDRVKPGAHFAFQSNNMFDIPGHINCVNHIGEFKLQLPDNAEVLIEDEIKDERGTRFTLIGKL